MNILVLCTGNSARSVLLEQIFNHDSAGRVAAYSAGSRPTGQVHPRTLALLTQEGFPTEGLRSKSWDEFTSPGAPKMDIVLTVCGSAASETCPIWPGAPAQAHWGVNDPAAAPVSDQQEAFRAAFTALRTSAKALLRLPVETMAPTVLTATFRSLAPK